MMRDEEIQDCAAWLFVSWNYLTAPSLQAAEEDGHWHGSRSPGLCSCDDCGSKRHSKILRFNQCACSADLLSIWDVFIPNHIVAVILTSARTSAPNPLDFCSVNGFTPVAFPSQASFYTSLQKTVVEAPPAGETLLQILNLADGEVRVTISETGLFPDPIKPYEVSANSIISHRQASE